MLSSRITQLLEEVPHYALPNLVTHYLKQLKKSIVDC